MVVADESERLQADFERRVTERMILTRRRIGERSGAQLIAKLSKSGHATESSKIAGAVSPENKRGLGGNDRWFRCGND